MKKRSLLTLCALSVSSFLIAGDFQINLQGVRQVAMGGSGVANPLDAATLFYNPAGLSSLSGFQLNASGYLYAPSYGYASSPTGGYINHAKTNTSMPFAFYAGGRVKENSRLGFGIGVYTPFGRNLDWGTDWSGRYMIQNSTLRTMFVQPTISYRIDDVISIGAGFIYGNGYYELNKALPYSYYEGGEGGMRLYGDAQGFGYNLGINIKPTERISIGASFRSHVKMKIDEGVAKFHAPPTVSDKFPVGMISNFNSEIHLPYVVTVGGSIKASDKLTLQADFVYTGWSYYDSTSVYFDQISEITAEPLTTVRNYRNTFAVRAGADYKVLDELSVMAGLGLDPAAANRAYMSPDAIDGDRFTLSAGVNVQPINKLNIMAALSYTTMPTRRGNYMPANFTGAYQSRVLVPCLGISYTF